MRSLLDISTMLDIPADKFFAHPRVRQAEAATSLLVVFLDQYPREYPFRQKCDLDTPELQTASKIWEVIEYWILLSTRIIAQCSEELLDGAVESIELVERLVEAATWSSLTAGCAGICDDPPRTRSAILAVATLWVTSVATPNIHHPHRLLGFLYQITRVFSEELGDIIRNFFRVK